MKHTLKIDNWTIYWHFLNFTTDVEKYKILLVAERAFKQLEVCLYPLKFKSTQKPSEAQIKIEFDKSYDRHWRKKGSIAFATYPHTKNPWVITFNDTITWNFNKLLQVLTHEGWHAVWLKHSDDPESPMSTPYSDDRPIDFTKEDKKMLAILYRIERHQYLRRLLDWYSIIKLSEQGRIDLAEVLWLESSDTWHIIKRIYN